MHHVIAKTIEITKDGHLVIDGIRLPWYIGEWVEIAGDSSLYELRIGIFADRIILNTETGVRDTQKEQNIAGVITHEGS